MGIFPIGKCLLTAHANGRVEFWNTKPSNLFTFQLPFNLNCSAVSPANPIFAVGGNEGQVNVYWASWDEFIEPQLILSKIIPDLSIRKVF